MLAEAGTRRAAIHRRTGDSGRCACPDCDKGAPKKVQRTREERAWRKEHEAEKAAEPDVVNAPESEQS